ncbi:hypothetical protein PN466_08715 [Roseofilum reptotaenium CS-1145]|nr:hypothetical protein [Roseofilum reptotaenium]MDB9517029.1 hypothetical protein [Roseofilum reptotaenium CS-1145]
MNHYAHPEVLVDSQWLADRLDDPSLRVIEVDMNPALYQETHIPGAVFWNVLNDLFQPNLRLIRPRSKICFLDQVLPKILRLFPMVAILELEPGFSGF